MSWLRTLLVCLALAIAAPSFAVSPDEVLADPVLEARARDISAGLRCLVCQNESIDDSEADLAKDLRILVRERLVAGDSDEEVRQYLVDRYGEYVLLNPRFSTRTLILWIAAPLFLLIGIGAAIIAIRRRRPVPVTELTKEEQAALDALRE